MKIVNASTAGGAQELAVVHHGDFALTHHTFAIRLRVTSYLDLQIPEQAATSALARCQSVWLQTPCLLGSLTANFQSLQPSLHSV